MEGLEVGQVLYVVSKKSDRVVPIQVCEVVSRKTLEGELTSYQVMVETQKSDLESLDGQVYRTLDEASIALRTKFDRWLDERLLWAKEKCAAWYPQPNNPGPGTPT